MQFVEWHLGASRLVFLIGSIAIKVPCIKRVSVLTRWGQLLQGRNCNRAERAAWIAQKYPNLCPIVYADSSGWIVVMLRAEAPMSDDDFDEWYHSDDWPHVYGGETPYELGGKDAGRLPCGRRVMIDYGVRGMQVDLSKYFRSSGSPDA
ncbi:MAG TPA: hypothetical protein VIT22_09955 [Pseudoxanthomonas sp.]